MKTPAFAPLAALCQLEPAGTTAFKQRRSWRRLDVPLRPIVALNSTIRHSCLFGRTGLARRVKGLSACPNNVPPDNFCPSRHVRTPP